MLSLYTGQRTKNCQLIGRAPCVKVTPIKIWPWDNKIEVDGFLWGRINAKVHLLALDDGFENQQAFFDFFKRYHRKLLDNFEIIEWDPEKLDPHPGLPPNGESANLGEGE